MSFHFFASAFIPLEFGSPRLFPVHSFFSHLPQYFGKKKYDLFYHKPSYLVFTSSDLGQDFLLQKTIISYLSTTQYTNLVIFIFSKQQVSARTKTLLLVDIPEFLEQYHHSYNKPQCIVQKLKVLLPAFSFFFKDLRSEGTIFFSALHFFFTTTTLCVGNGE